MNSAGFETRTRRWREQRWLLDAVIQSSGIDWDQPRTMAFASPCGPDALPDFQAANSRIRKFADIHREYASVAERRVAKARAFEQQSRSVAARESWFVAAQLWACARWPLFDVNELHRHYDSGLRDAYARFAALAPRPVRRVEIPFEGSSLPAWLHLPREPLSGERFGCVVQVPGMDNNKEQMVAMYGDKLLERGIAVLAVDGPGQAETIVRGLRVTPDGHARAGGAIFDWLARQPFVDPAKIAVRGVSLGSYFAIQMAAAAGERCAAVVSAFVAHEPGLRTLLEQASPTFKVRLMMMAGYDDEAAFDEFANTFDIRPWAAKLRCPILVQAGEADELSPLAHTETMLESVASAKRLVVYEGHKHVLRGTGAVAAGESPDQLYADWVAARLRGEPMESVRDFVTVSGALRTTPL